VSAIHFAKSLITPVESANDSAWIHMHWNIEWLRVALSDAGVAHNATARST